MIRNVHERMIAAPVDLVGALLDGLGGPDDELWPVPEWPPLVLDRPLAVGAQGGHGIVRYRVVLHDPGRIVGFAFDPGTGLVGVHSLSVEPAGSERTRVRHVMEARPVGVMKLSWPLAGRRLHDTLTESLLDRVEHAVGLRPRTTERWSPWMRALRRLEAERAVAVAVPDTRLLVDALPRVDFADAHAVRARPGTPADPQVWADAMFRDPPAWACAGPGMFDTVARTADEVLLGSVEKHLDLRVSVCREPDRVVVSTAVQIHTRLGRACFAPVRLVHPVIVRAMLTRAADRLSRHHDAHRADSTSTARRRRPDGSS